MKILELLTSKDPKVDKQKYSVLKVLPGQLSSFYALALVGTPAIINSEFDSRRTTATSRHAAVDPASAGVSLYIPCCTSSDRPYQQIRKQRGTRKGFFNDIQALTKYFWFESWQQLIAFLRSDSQPLIPTNSS